MNSPPLYTLWMVVACLCVIFPAEGSIHITKTPGLNQEHMCSKHIVHRRIEPDLLLDVAYVACISDIIGYNQMLDLDRKVDTAAVIRVVFPYNEITSYKEYSIVFFYIAVIIVISIKNISVII